MISIKDTYEAMNPDSRHWAIHIMDFVDEFRQTKNLDAVRNGFLPKENKFSALAASVVEELCGEQHLPTPEWTRTIPPVPDPWFVSGMESLKAIALVESPVHFRKRKIFVLENFLSRA